MSEVHDIPAYNPADLSSLEGLLYYLADQINQEMECCLPAFVVSYDRSTNMAVVQPAISEVATSGQKISRDKLYNIPVLTLSGGGFFVNFPLSQGDTGWIVACDRDISLFKQNLQETAPNTFQKHRFSDAFFIPDKVKNFNISGEDASGLVIANLSGNNKIVLNGSNLNITSAAITVTGPTTFKSPVTAEDNVTAQKDVTINQNLTVDQNATITQNLDVTGSATAQSLHAKTGATGSFVSADNKNIVVQDGIVIGIG